MCAVILDDIPVSSKRQDVLGRENLVDLVVESIKVKISSQHPAICFGVYGGWGEGKTSFMRMIAEGLENSKNTEILWFNPWDKPSHERMVVEFFAALSRFTFEHSKALSMAISSYGKAFFSSALSLENQELSFYGEKLSHCIPYNNHEFYNLKDCISQELVTHKKHLVVFIDDIDRLQSSEIRTIFKLIRQIADFKNVIYVIGADPEVVSVALGDLYDNNKLLGRDYLKKFVQIPIVLPPIQESRIRILIEKCLSPVLRGCQVDTSDKSVQNVVEKLTGALQSIRDVYRYINQLSLVLPLIHAETEFVDLCLLESLKFLNEQGWISVYKFKNELLKNNRPPFLVSDELKNRFNNAVQTIMAFYPIRNQGYVYDILTKYLFPEQNQFYADSASKNIRNEIYFRQYFICGVPDEIISQVDILTFKKRIDENDIHGAVVWLDAKAVLYSASELERAARTTLFLEKKENSDTEDFAFAVSKALSLSRLANGFSYSTIQNKNSIDSTIGLVLIPLFLGRYEKDGFVVNKQRESSLLIDIYSSCPLNFCLNLQCVIYSREGVTPSDEFGVFRVLRDRVIQPDLLEIFNYSFVIKQVFFSVWRKTDPEECNRFLKKVLERKEFDIGLEIKNWLDAAGEKERLQQIIYLSDIYSPVFDDLIKNLNRSPLKKDALVKKFVINCGKFNISTDENN